MGGTQNIGNLVPEPAYLKILKSLVTDSMRLHAKILYMKNSEGYLRIDQSSVNSEPNATLKDSVHPS